MLMETVTACFLLICLIVFFSMNLHNVLVVHEHSDKKPQQAEVDRPSGLIFNAVALGTVVYFFEAVSYSLLILTSSISVMSVVAFTVSDGLAFHAQIFGMLLTAFGYFLFLWSVATRGKYASSWAMRENHRLVTWGPYRLVRHPSYLAYFAMFIGFLFIWPTWLSLIPLIAIPAYYQVTLQEERLLERRFGEEYLKYQQKTGRFIPRIKTHARRTEVFNYEAKK
ncbi:MAG TPA: isoprenylcysteine carboxylmethyltransferase family protein [Candidatus Acidoferrum sp.]|nr:isoprenylcysteine carboxylmethyltransferase family protein [Candidatus Acidoferrum sp.]